VSEARECTEVLVERPRFRSWIALARPERGIAEAPVHEARHEVAKSFDPPPKVSATSLMFIPPSRIPWLRQTPSTVTNAPSRLNDPSASE
jgi:hypothetical protein